MVPSLSESEVSEAAIRAGVPKRLVGMAIEGRLSLSTPAVAAIQQAEAGGKSLVALSGGVGCGKSAAAARYALGAVRRLQSLQWLQAWHLARMSAFDATAFEKLASVPVLILDDLGAEYQDEKGFWMMMLGGIINDRYDNVVTMTLLTTNLNAAAFKARYGERIADRIREIGVFCELPNPSLRSPT